MSGMVPLPGRKSESAITAAARRDARSCNEPRYNNSLMIDNYRNFQTGPDPFGATWRIEFRWQQNGISIRHSDSVDVKFFLSDGKHTEEKVIALPHPLLLAQSAMNGHPVTDALCMKIAALHLVKIIETGEDMEKTLVTLTAPEMEEAASQITAKAA